MTDWHPCHFCGELVLDGYTTSGERHYLSDCRRDLVAHEIGEDCTWHYAGGPMNCYAYQDDDLNWTPDHVHFYKDGPT